MMRKRNHLVRFWNALINLFIEYLKYCLYGESTSKRIHFLLLKVQVDMTLKNKEPARGCAIFKPITQTLLHKMHLEICLRAQNVLLGII